ncbi:chloride channel protein [Sulfuracidifex metallicus]|uniref:CBS domain-containing protein n=1 Tax=Sulfuracidifex metallicus DSM 6482 = JCM 9184 TaxID=523847 RepID=A0A6A9QIZ4_SULME|nr:chloride channel protein [Sulfuracidifex metallicus]MUN28946.1 CBS domain-containing protein [Sulfuracidifex metallicus DSM 6482 = JCM 9184]WOE50547.1 chloride channel protein [Sulfuracidifex metallicus DSM 6482 = JCM 9184]
MKIGLKELPYYEKWIIAGFLIGVISGITITLFYFTTELFSILILRTISGIEPPKAFGDVASLSLPLPRGYIYLLPLSVGLGGLMVGIILYFIPEIKGSGTDYSISAYHNSKEIKWYIAPIKLVASSLTLGSGGSAGDEGPSAVISASIGNSLTRRLGLPLEDSRRAIAIGIGTGIGIVFKSPIAGALLSAEILYRRDLEPDVIFPSLISASTGYVIYGYFTGYEPLLGFYNLPFDPLRLPIYAIMGVISGILSIFYVKSFRWVKETFSKVPLWISPTIGGIIMGGIGILFPEVIGKGYGWIDLAEFQDLTKFSSSSPLPFILILLFLPFAKIIATDLTVGSGGSGGIFAPGLVIGAFAGLDLGLIFNKITPTVVPYVAPVVVIGMVSFLAGSVKVPLSAIILVTEITDSIQLLPGTMIAVAISYIVSGRYSLIEGLPESRKESPVHSAEFEVPLLEKIRVRECHLDETSVREDDQIERVLRITKEKGLRSVPVTDDNNNFVGVIYTRNLKRGRKVRDFVIKGVPVISPDSSLEHAWEVMVASRSTSVPVVDGGKLMGTLTFTSMLDRYKEREEEVFKGPDKSDKEENSKHES